MAHRVQHNNSRGPFKGGFKYHPEASLADVERSVAQPPPPPAIFIKRLLVAYSVSLHPVLIQSQLASGQQQAWACAIGT
jgi:hypothetical protein